jgi:hypothetical protein
MEASVSTKPPLPLERLALVLPGAPVVPVGDPVVPVAAVPPFQVSALARHPLRVTVSPL